MCKEVFVLLKKLDLSKVETRLALQCAPVITGVKIANLLIVPSKEEKRVGDVLNGTGIEHYRLVQQDKTTTYLLFRRLELAMYLQNSMVEHALVEYGYNDLSFACVLKTFQERYVSYMKYGNDFPHEMGLILGYPIEDVEGFIKNKGENYLYAGYWKVYQDVEEKKLLFEAYESAKEGMILLVANGYPVRAVIEYFCDNSYLSIYEQVGLR